MIPPASGSRQVTVPLMRMQARVYYNEARDCQLLGLPYQRTNRVLCRPQMWVLLPKEVDGLPALEAALSQESRNEWSGFATDVKIVLPKFRLQTDDELTGAFRDLGLRSAFGDDADFSGMTETSEPLRLSSAVQSTSLSVDEHGTEAASAFAAYALLGAAPHPPPVPVFRADHPFLFVIRDEESKAILFLGRVVDPTTTA